MPFCYIVYMRDWQPYSNWIDTILTPSKLEVSFQKNVFSEYEMLFWVETNHSYMYSYKNGQKPSIKKVGMECQKACKQG